jgi:periplasmic divalent cation tolerance protein
VIVVAITTLASEEAARKLARSLVENRLAACATIVANASSFYAWNGAIEESAEWLLIVKTASEKIAAIEAFFAQNHPYELPELIFTAFNASDRYAKWVEESLKSC